MMRMHFNTAPGRPREQEGPKQAWLDFSGLGSEWLGSRQKTSGGVGPRKKPPQGLLDTKTASFQVPGSNSQLRHLQKAHWRDGGEAWEPQCKRKVRPPGCEAD